MGAGHRETGAEVEGMICRICGGDENKTRYEFREQMFGLGNTFVYAECRSCKTLQIVDPPADLSVYYPNSYYSYTAEPIGLRAGWLRETSRRFAAGYLMRGKGVLGSLAIMLRPELRRVFPAYLSNQALPRTFGLQTSILDVGCGQGQLLTLLRHFGFSEDSLTVIALDRHR